ncbi:NEGR1 regulator, partial [Nothocercus nigrocapillus]|nr:NEGR1 regulator [Nothocercus nigrocapillus]
RCYLEDGASKGAWLNRSSIIFAGSDKWSVDPRVSIATANRREYSLQIQDVDVTDDGPYTCSVQTQHTPRTMQVHLIVQVSPKIFRISNDLVVNEGSNVTLVCLAAGKPEPSISWRHISPSGESRCGAAASRLEGTRSPSGACSALARSSLEQASYLHANVYFTIFFSVAPTIQELKSSGVMLGGNGLIRCEGAGVPAPAFEWYKGERKEGLLNKSQLLAFSEYPSNGIPKVGSLLSSPCPQGRTSSVTQISSAQVSVLNSPSTAQYGITGAAEVVFSCWSLVLTLSSLTSMFYLKNIILQ